MIFTVKHNGWPKSSFVAGGHLTQPAIESVYSGVVSIGSICLILLSTKLNDLKIYQAIVGNVYSASYTKERICFIAGRELLLLVWKVTFSFNLRYYMGYIQVANGSMKYSKTSH